MVVELCTEGDIPYIELDSYQLRLEVEEFSGEFLEMARQELRETPEVKTEGICALRKLLENEPDFKMPPDENDFLLRFLRPCKFQPEQAFKLMKKYYKFKLKYPKYSNNLVPSVLKDVIAAEISNFVPLRAKDGSRVWMVKIENWNPKVVQMSELFRVIMMFVEIGMTEPKTQLGGLHVILDMNGLTLNQVYQFGPSFVKGLLEWVQDCLPIRLRGIHIINEPRIFNILFTLFKPLLNEKLKKKVTFHGSNTNKIVGIIGRELLPVCYGGDVTAPPIPGNLMAEIFCLYENTFQRLNAIGYTKEKVLIESN